MSTLEDVVMEGANMDKLTKKKQFLDECLSKGITIKNVQMRYVNKIFNDMEIEYNKKGASMSDITFDEIADGLKNEIPALADYLFAAQDDLITDDEEESENDAAEASAAPAPVNNAEKEENVPKPTETKKTAAEKPGKQEKKSVSVLKDLMSNKVDRSTAKLIRKEIAAKKNRRDYASVCFSLFSEDNAILKSILDCAKSMDTNDEKRTLDGLDMSYWSSIMHVATKLLIEKIEAEGHEEFVEAIVAGLKKENERKDEIDDQIAALLKKIN